MSAFNPEVGAEVDFGGRLYIVESVDSVMPVHEAWRPVTITLREKPAPKPQPLWADPSIPDDAWIAFDTNGVAMAQMAGRLRKTYPGSMPAWWSNVRRVWLIDDTEVAVKKADIEEFLTGCKERPIAAAVVARDLLSKILDGAR